jgi:hypothetical protein
MQDISCCLADVIGAIVMMPCARLSALTHRVEHRERAPLQRRQEILQLHVDWFMNEAIAAGRPCESLGHTLYDMCHMACIYIRRAAFYAIRDAHTLAL